MLNKYDKIISKIEEMSISAQPRRCLRNHSSSCSLCLDKCPVKAISIDSSEETRSTPRVDFRLCNRCGICAALCPTEVFKITDITDEKILLYIEMLSDYTSALAFGCSYQAERQEMVNSVPVITLPCLGRLNEAMLLAPTTHGISTTWINSSSCEECPNQALSLIKRTVRTSQELLEIFQSQSKIFLGPEPPKAVKKRRPFRKKLPPLADFEPFSRRGFFENIRKSVVEVGVLLVEGELAPFLREPDLPRAAYHLPGGRRSLLDLLKKLKKPDRSEVATGDFPFLSLKISESCSGCESCVYYCPTRALTKVRLSEETAGLQFSISRCTKCDLCRELCPEKAIHYREFFNPDVLLSERKEPLISFGSYTCKRCKSEFLSSEPANLCRYCRKKQALFGT